MPDVLIIFLVVLVLVVLAGGAFVATRRRGPDLELRPQKTDKKVDLRTKEDEVEESGVSDSVSLDAADLEAEIEVEPAKPSFFERLTKARSAFSGYLGDLVGLSKVKEDTWEELEEALIQADVGVKTSMSLIADVKRQAKEVEAESGEEVLKLLKQRMHTELEYKDRSLNVTPEKTNVWLFVGVNGVGKTTTIGKLGKRLKSEGHTPLMAAGDTFRAAAAEQLTTWAERSDVEIVRGAEGSDPSSVIFDAIAAATARKSNVVLADTAGRLQNKTNLMHELAKIRRVASKESGHVSEVLLVLDATTGQNGMSQAKVFTEVVDVTGVVLTKLDGSAKGGIVFAIESELGIPVKLVGLGEGVNDLVDFDSKEFVEALFE